MRNQIRSEVESIVPLDAIEVRSRADVLAWIDSGVELCRVEKPASPPKHLITYFAVADGEYMLLVDHINAELWLPPGGHVEPNEHPRATVRREAEEELALDAKFLFSQPLFVSVTETVGKTKGHEDVALWYVLRGDRKESLHFDMSEFFKVRWFHNTQVPLDRTDPNMGRFLRKLYP